MVDLSLSKTELRGLPQDHRKKLFLRIYFKILISFSTTTKKSSVKKTFSNK